MPTKRCWVLRFEFQGFCGLLVSKPEKSNFSERSGHAFSSGQFAKSGAALFGRELIIFTSVASFMEIQSPVPQLNSKKERNCVQKAALSLSCVRRLSCMSSIWLFSAVLGWQQHLHSESAVSTSLGMWTTAFMKHDHAWCNLVYRLQICPRTAK